MRAFISLLLATFFLVFTFVNNLPAQCRDYTCDSSAVRAILDNNGMFSVPVAKVSTVKEGRIVALTCIGSGPGQNLPHQMNVLPERFGDLRGLQRADFSGNCIRKLPQRIGELWQLSELYMYNNRLDRIPYSITQCGGLRILDLTKNRLYMVSAQLKHWMHVYTIAGDWHWRQNFTVNAAEEAKKIAVKVEPPHGIPALEQVAEYKKDK